MKARIPTGYAVIVLETDLEQQPPFEETSLTPMEKQVFDRLSTQEQETVRQGTSVLVMDISSGEQVAAFNLQGGYHPPESAMNSMGRFLHGQLRRWLAEGHTLEELRERGKETVG